MTRTWRCGLAAALVLLSAAWVGAVPAAAQSSIPGGCTDASGVTVVVDFGTHLGGKVAVGCASQPVSSGLDALSRAGFDVSQAARSAGFVCRIDGLPSDDPCITASPASAYWSYWYRLAGGDWVYSSLGAGSRVPPPGSVEGWSFAFTPNGGAATPPALPATTAAPPTTSAPAPNPTTPPANRSLGSIASGASPGTTPVASVKTAPHVTGSGSGAAPSSVPAATATSPSTSAAPGSAASAATSTTGEPSVVVESARAARAAQHNTGSSNSGGTSAGTIVALLFIVVAGAGAAIVSRRRARAA